MGLEKKQQKLFVTYTDVSETSKKRNNIAKEKIDSSSSENIAILDEFKASGVPAIYIFVINRSTNRVYIC